MIKLVPPGSYDFGAPPLRRVKVARQGLGPSDRRDFLKFAAHDFLGQLDRLRPGEVPVHLFALGATEATGSNRNGDGFAERWCLANHDTFVKDAHYFFNHANREHDLRFGRVVGSAYNGPMRRVELLVGLFETKEAAERDHPTLGRVATTSLEKLARDEALSVSMACLIDHDVCDHCGNKAKHRGEYCDDRRVKLASGRVIPACSGFGCRTGLTKVASDGRVQFVDNPDPRWFDISEVPRNADRIAFALGRLEKAAGAIAVGGAELAERHGLTAPAPSSSDPKAARVLLELRELDRLSLEPVPAGFDYALAKQAGVVPAMPGEDRDRPQALRALADSGVVLDVDAWLDVFAGKQAADASADVAACVPSAASRLLGRPDVVDVLARNAFLPSAHPATVKFARWARDLVPDHSIDPAHAAIRAERAALRGLPPAAPTAKRASAPYRAAEELAGQYALYAASFLAARPADDPSLPRARRMVARRLATS